MKYLIATLVLMTSMCAHANTTHDVSIVETREDINTPTPEQLKGATIIVQLKDGTLHKMKADKFKVVPRKQQFKNRETIITDKTTCDVQPVPAPVVINRYFERKIPVRDKNILSLTIKRSLGDYQIQQNGNSYQIDNKFSPAVGLMYQRNVYKHLYLGVEADTHSELGGNIGIGF